jgi:hypothetical protein
VLVKRRSLAFDLLVSIQSTHEKGAARG